MSKSDYDSNDKNEFGSLLAEARLSITGKHSQRYVADCLGVSNTTLKYFEDGINVPSLKNYKFLIQFFKDNDVSNEILTSIEEKYYDLKGVPSIDVSSVLDTNPQLATVIKQLDGLTLNESQLQQISNLFEKISKESKNEK